MLRLAVIGAGHLGRFHAKLACELDNAELVAVVDPVAETAQRLAAECRTAAATDISKVLDKIDAAIVAAPTSLHHAIGRQLLSRGIHVLMEKPLAGTLAECDDLVGLAEANRCVLQVGHIERFNPAFKQALAYAGDARYVTAARYGGYTFRSTDIGVVLDLMIHDLDLTMALVASPVVEVSAFGLPVIGPHEDVAMARLHFADGRLADLSASRVSYHAARQMQIWSSSGHVSIDFGSRTAVVAEPAAPLREGRFDPDQLTGEEKARLKDHIFEELIPLRRLEAQASNPLLEEQRDFLRSIRDQAQPRVSGRQARDVVAVAERILASLNAQSRVPSARPTGDDAAQILRGPHWHRPLVAMPGDLRRPA
jgi:predicted dehydrogenase